MFAGGYVSSTARILLIRQDYEIDTYLEHTFTHLAQQVERENQLFKRVNKNERLPSAS